MGNSITHGWETACRTIWGHYFGDINSHNLGFSVDRKENVLWRFDNGAVEGISPELTVLMIITNSTRQRQDSAECTARGIEMIVYQLLNQWPDMLHPNENGYQLWVEKIKPVITQLLNE